MTKINLLWVLFFVLNTASSMNAWGQLTDFGISENAAVEKLSANGYLSVNKVQPGSQFQIAIVIQFAEGWHANANPAGQNLIPTEVLLPEASNFTFGEVVYPPGEILEIASIGKAPVYHDEVVIGIQTELRETAPLEATTLALQLRYQACSDEACLFPETVAIPIPIEVVGLDQPIRRENDAIFATLKFGSLPEMGASPGEEKGSLARALSGGQVWLAFLLVFAGGILTSLTPCVYPLIPITVSIFGANESTGLLKSFLLSVIYVLGIVVTYAILGVAVASTGAVFGQIMANPWVVGFISVILVSLGLSMLGVFELRLPYAIQSRLNTVGGTGFAGAFAMGTVAGVIAAPCTGPALAVVLTYIATTGSLFLGFWLMFTYALGMGLLFIGIGTFSGLLSALPRSGGWMYVLENLFGIAIITMALYFLKDVFEPLQSFLQNSLVFFGIALLLIVSGLLLGKLTQRFSDIPHRTQLRKACGILLAVLGSYMLIGGIQQPAGPELNWVYDETEGLEIAKRENKLVMLDFYASWCAACKELDHETYSDPAVAAKLENYVNIKLDFTRSSKTTQALTQKYQIPGLPVIIFMDAQENIRKRVSGFINAEKMLELLEEIEQQ